MAVDNVGGTPPDSTVNLGGGSESSRTTIHNMKDWENKDPKGFKAMMDGKAEEINKQSRKSAEHCKKIRLEAERNH